MPWKECNNMSEKLRFIARLLDGEKMAELCREFQISRKTGYKIWTRYQASGLEALSDRSRRPYKQANRLPMQIENLIVSLKEEKPTWGAPKIRERLKQKYPDVPVPATSTVHAVLDRHGLVVPKKRRRYKAEGTLLQSTNDPNELWCADYKGQFLLGDKTYCYPLTITDFASRYLLSVEALDTTKEQFAFTVFENTFKEYGLPKRIRTDNGVPFSSAHSIFGLSKLSVWWLRLGIEIERIKPGHPEQNGRHERMHLTLKKETTKPSGQNLLQQQEKFDAFIEEFNFERPHQALEMKTPNQFYKPSPRIYKGLEEIEYPKAITVTQCGRICVDGRKINFSQVFAGQTIGIRQVEDKLWQVSFMNYDLGFYDEEIDRVEVGLNPFGAKVLPMSSE